MYIYACPIFLFILSHNRQCSAKAAFLQHLSHKIPNVPLSLGLVRLCPKKIVFVIPTLF